MRKTEKAQCSSKMASSKRLLELFIKSGLNLNIRVQNSISSRAPSPSISPSMTMHINSSSLIPCIPSKAEFFFKLSNVITSFSLSISRQNPFLSSFMNPSVPSLSTMVGKKSSKTTTLFSDAIDAADENDEVKKLDL